ncbi:hypothetical protein B484DRAFT_456785 [Ochromonadaceae sp. CCMP2298]|nr:hypothetical protein B484DRAFT_456785 [Ochromonadaceae sp. CCMP2298]|mmetsp:Transcript_11597/g.25820  ORF Transcript_11597/g.25820 Transcript_11597/m.25820 type:complete len:406 (+) Transcript_11597:111-1328(+)|eukprot:CAMPEP_0173198256 /NCGR_PEP_ID=MMETSP1141-20130122/16593_1 /TAXON_ID=483371 /ORGANISM="non described non described, Strain CCMP2298" /LENGTH=405 /DNA_ID=CAMNT_0014123043 /DNA_START=78 /DNA_END=1295 /DNA_ORIENTATION=-
MNFTSFDFASITQNITANLPTFGSTDENAVKNCTQCQVEFTYKVFKHQCRKCGLQYCNDCTSNKVIIPKDLIADRTAEHWYPTDLLASDEDYRKPQKVCYACFYLLRDHQSQLRKDFSRANQETCAPEDPLESMMLKLPSAVDFYLNSEIQKAANILNNFQSSMDGKGVPRKLLGIARGVVFFTILKVGFVFTGRYGSGVIVAKLPDGKWSAPSAVQITGLGWGLQAGAELTTVMLILATDSAVNAFKSTAQISVGAELGVSVGPLGRSLETDVTAGREGAAHAFSYAQSKGLFVGASLEASGITIRNDVNRAFYGESVSAVALLQGEYPPPKGAEILYKALADLTTATIEGDMSDMAGDFGETEMDFTKYSIDEDVNDSETQPTDRPDGGEPVRFAANGDAIFL